MLVPEYLFLALMLVCMARYALSQIHSSNCRRSSIFNPENENQLLVYQKNDHQSRIVNSLQVPSLLSCSGRCISTFICRSFNFKKLGTGMNCHILDFDKNNANVALQSEIGWYHFEPTPQVFNHSFHFLLPHRFHH